MLRSTDVSYSPQVAAFPQGAFINMRLEEAVASEETDRRLHVFAQRFEAVLRTYYVMFKQIATTSKERVDQHISELIFQLDSDVRKVRSDQGASAKVWSTAMRKIVTELAEIPYTFHGSESLDEKETGAAEAEYYDCGSPVSVCRGELPGLPQEHHDAAVYKTWRRYLANTEVEAFSSAPDEGDGRKPTEKDFVATALYARWEASFELVNCLAGTENLGQHILPVMAYVDLLMVTAKQIQCFATGTKREMDGELAGLRGPDCETDREKLLQEVVENMLFFCQVWWWWKTKVSLVREKIRTYDAVHGRLVREKGDDALKTHETTVATWNRALVEAEEAASAVVDAIREDTLAVAVATLRHDITLALSHPSEETLGKVQVTCRVIARAISFFFRSLPNEFYSSPCGASAHASDGATAANDYLRVVMREALRPIAEDALERAEEWFAPSDSPLTPDAKGGGVTSPTHEALHAVVGFVEHYWGEELTEADDVVQTLKRLLESTSP